MKKYIKNQNVLILDSTYIPLSADNTDYIRALEEVEQGLAIIEDYQSVNSVDWETVKLERSRLLQETDWVGASDANPKPSKVAWLNYRQALRNIPQIFPTPQSVIWPTKPS